MSDFPRFTWRVRGDEKRTVSKCPVCELGMSVYFGADGESLLDEFERVHPKHCPNRPTEPCGPPEE